MLPGIHLKKNFWLRQKKEKEGRAERPFKRKRVKE